MASSLIRTLVRSRPVLSNGAAAATDEPITAGAAETPSPATRQHLPLVSSAGPSRDGLLKRLLAFADALTALLAALSLGLAVHQPLATVFWAATSVPLWIVLDKLH